MARRLAGARVSGRAAGRPGGEQAKAKVSAERLERRLQAIAALCDREREAYGIAVFRANVVDALLAELEAPCAVVFPRFDDPGTAGWPVAERGWPWPHPSEAMYLVDLVRQHGSPLVFDPSNLPLPGFLQAAGLSFGCLVACAAPASGAPDPDDGILGVFGRQPGGFAPEDLSFMLAVANLLGSAERRARQESALVDFARDLADREAGFVSAAAHELRTPLAVLRGYAGMLAADRFSLSEQERRDFLARICESCDLLTGLLDKLIGGWCTGYENVDGTVRFRFQDPDPEPSGSAD